MVPKYIKFNYRNVERVWLRVEKIQNNYYYGYIDNIPISKGLKYKQYIRVHKNKTLEMT
jgi:hypothetical protein